jgi:hypothetical protein
VLRRMLLGPAVLAAILVMSPGLRGPAAAARIPVANLTAPAATTTPPAGPFDAQNVTWLAHVPGASIAGLAFIRYPREDVMFGDGMAGLTAWSLADPAHPVPIGQLGADVLMQPGDTMGRGFWEGEHLQVDQARHLVILARDRASYGSFTRTGIYVVDARDPRQLRLLGFHPVPAGHTAQCLDGCRYLWSAGSNQGVWVTDLTSPSAPVTSSTAVDQHRNDGATDYVHDTDVDAAGVAWTAGFGGVRGYWTSGSHRDPTTGAVRTATPNDPVPYAGGAFVSPNQAMNTFGHNSWRPVRAIGGFPAGSLLFVADEDFAPTCRDNGQLIVLSLAGSFGGEAWASTKAQPFRLPVLGSWGPVGSPGQQPSNRCSAHWFEPLTGVGDGTILVEAFYDQGTRFIDVADPRHPVQVGYFEPQAAVAATPAFRDGLVYAAQYTGGVDVLRFTPGR